MMTLEAIWTNDALHVWSLSDGSGNGHDGAGPTDEATVSTDRAPLEVGLTSEQIRHCIGDGWDSLLASGASASTLRLLLPTSSPRGDHWWDPTDAATEPSSEASCGSLAEYRVPSLAFHPADAIDLLTAHAVATLRDVNLASSFRYWVRVARLVLELLAKQRFLPAVYRAEAGAYYGLWRVAVDDHDTSDRLHALIVAMPPVCRSMAEAKGEAQASDLVESFLWRSVDSLVRRCLAGDELAHAIQDLPVESLTAQTRWLQALVRSDASMTGSDPECAATQSAVEQWLDKLHPAVSERACRTCFQLHAPDLSLERPVAEDDRPWRMTLHVQATADPLFVVDAEQLSADRVERPRILPRPFDHAEAQLRADVDHAARYFPPISSGASADGPVKFSLTIEEAYAFLRDVAPMLESEGYGVWLPTWWRENRPRLRMRLDIRPAEDGSEVANSAISLESLVAFDWHVALGGEDISLEELTELAHAKQSLVQLRGQWTEIQPADIQAALTFLDGQQHGRMTLFEAMRQYYLADDLETGLPVAGLRTHGWLESVLGGGEGVAAIELADQPAGFQGEMRPYQCKGMSWMRFLSRIGLGGCLADDMGLGKTIQMIALWLYEKQEGVGAGPTLLVVPTSLVGNWHREIERFAPTLSVMVHHGLERLSGPAFVEEAKRHDVVVSTYALTHRDFDHLNSVEWSRIVLDEAQNIKNPAAKQSAAVRSLRALHRLALTGTPIENRLSELWSILDFLNPGYLGSAGDFRRRFAVPIERHHDTDRSERLRHLIRPFVLRRIKSDPSIEVDLPEKMEMKVYCTLTREQASLYEAVVNDMLGEIERSQGMRRRGLILAALVKLKQVCNHPAQFLGDGSSLPGRSGKCDRLAEMIEVVLAENDAALIFTQYRQMGNLLVQLLENSFGRSVLFLHGGTPRKARDRMVNTFQDESVDSPLFVLSLKAGGFGLNLTAANHVFHYDRWWNPAVEDQATDRVHRLGQERRVQVHKFVCLGTLEERIDALLEEKRNLADNIVGSGENWLTELSTDQLRDLFTLSQDAVAEC